MNIVAAGVIGALLGVVFFGGLRLTVQRAMASKYTAIWFLGSSIMRLAIALAGFYYAAQGNWQRLLACAAGFLAARLLVLRVTKSIEEKQLNIKRAQQS